MKNTKTLLLMLLLTFFSASSQISNPVKWQSKIEKKSATEYLLTFDGIIEKDYHLYSQYTPEGGPLPMEIILPDSKQQYRLSGKATESKTITKFSKAFGVNEIFFVKTVRIQQLIKILNATKPSVNVQLVYQVCKNVCIPQKISFEFDTKALHSKEIRATIK